MYFYYYLYCYAAVVFKALPLAGGVPEGRRGSDILQFRIFFLFLYHQNSVTVR
jgi:hypothetical protein